MSKPMLAAAGALSILAAVAVIIFVIFRLVSANRRKLAEKKPSNSDQLRERYIDALRIRYDTLFTQLFIPDHTLIVCSPAGLFSLSNETQRYYCWVNNGLLILFPVWGSVEARIKGQDAYMDNPDALSAYKIPISDILCFVQEQGLPHAFVALQYKKGGDIFTLTFSEDSAQVFAKLIPHKEYSHLLEARYPSSSRNIQDIKEKFLSLKELRQDELITEDEYAAKKKDILISM